MRLAMEQRIKTGETRHRRLNIHEMQIAVVYQKNVLQKASFAVTETNSTSSASDAFRSTPPAVQTGVHHRFKFDLVSCAM